MTHVHVENILSISVSKDQGKEKFSGDISGFGPALHYDFECLVPIAAMEQTFIAGQKQGVDGDVLRMAHAIAAWENILFVVTAVDSTETLPNSLETELKEMLFGSIMMAIGLYIDRQQRQQTPPETFQIPLLAEDEKEQFPTVNEFRAYVLSLNP